MKNLFTLVECQLGFPVFHEIEKVKVALGKEATRDFHYNFLDLDVTQSVSSSEYRTSVTPTIQEIMDTMRDVFRQSGLTEKDVDEVVLTGGTSQFPKIKENLTDIFGKDKLSEHNIYQSVVNGLAQFAVKQRSAV